MFYFPFYISYVYIFDNSFALHHYRLKSLFIQDWVFFSRCWVFVRSILYFHGNNQLFFRSIAGWMDGLTFFLHHFSTDGNRIRFFGFCFFSFIFFLVFFHSISALLFVILRSFRSSRFLFLPQNFFRIKKLQKIHQLSTPKMKMTLNKRRTRKRNPTKFATSIRW